MRGKDCSINENISEESDSEPVFGNHRGMEVGGAGTSKGGGDFQQQQQQQQQHANPPTKPGDVDGTPSKLAVVNDDEKMTPPSLVVDEDVGKDPILKKIKNTETTLNSAIEEKPAAVDVSTATCNYYKELEPYYRQNDDNDLEVNDTTEPLPTRNNGSPGAYASPGMNQVESDAQQRSEQQASIPGAYALASGVSPGMGLRYSQQSATTQESEGPPSAASANNNNNNNTNNADVLLAEALPVNEQDIPMFPAGTLEEAQPVQEQAARRVQKNKDRIQSRRLLMLVFLVVACCVVVLTLSLALGLSNNSSNELNFLDDIEIPTPTITTTRPLPPIENLEILYEELPQQTRDSLSRSDSPQYLAWEWLHSHPNITTYPEWRKKQLFAMVTFYHSFGGDHWPESTPSYGRWMDYNKSECSWIMNDKGANHFHQHSLLIFVPVYTVQDLRPCNDEGEVQTILLPKLSLPTTMKEGPSIPPEISLLSSLRIVVVLHSKLGNARLAADILIPELIQLPNLIHLSFQGSDARGTIPKEISQMTKLVRLSFGANRLSGSVPSQIGKMTSLELLLLDDVEGITGVLPSELGLMTSLTSLEMARNSFTGQIPTELGNLGSLKRLSLGGNQKLTGVLPNQLWELSHMEKLLLSDLPNLHGSILSTDNIMMMMPNLRTLHLDGSPHLSGTVPDQVCLLVEELEFDCSESLCGCDDCPCDVDHHHHNSSSGHNNTQTQAAVWNQSLP